MLDVLNLPAFENKKYQACDGFHAYGEIPTKEEPIRKLRLETTLPYNKHDCCYRALTGGRTD